jgi:hypothetical protein
LTGAAATLTLEGLKPTTWMRVAAIAALIAGIVPFPCLCVEPSSAHDAGPRDCHTADADGVRAASAGCDCVCMDDVRSESTAMRRWLVPSRTDAAIAAEVPRDPVSPSFHAFAAPRLVAGATRRVLPLVLRI